MSAASWFPLQAGTGAKDQISAQRFRLSLRASPKIGPSCRPLPSAQPARGGVASTRCAAGWHGWARGWSCPLEALSMPWSSEGGGLPVDVKHELEGVVLNFSILAWCTYNIGWLSGGVILAPS